MSKSVAIDAVVIGLKFVWNHKGSKPVLSIQISLAQENKETTSSVESVTDRLGISAFLAREASAVFFSQP